MAKRPSLAASMKAVAREHFEESSALDAPATSPEPAPAPTNATAPAPLLPIAEPRPILRPSQLVEEAGTGSGYRAKTREGMKRLTVVVPPEDHRRIKRLSVDLDRSIEDIMREALADLLQRHNA